MFGLNFEAISAERYLEVHLSGFYSLVWIYLKMAQCSSRLLNNRQLFNVQINKVAFLLEWASDKVVIPMESSNLAALFCEQVWPLIHETIMQSGFCLFSLLWQQLIVQMSIEQ